MTSSNGNIFRVTGHLSGEFTGPRWRQWRGALMFTLICARIVRLVIWDAIALIMTSSWWTHSTATTSMEHSKYGRRVLFNQTVYRETYSNCNFHSHTLACVSLFSRSYITVHSVVRHLPDYWIIVHRFHIRRLLHPSMFVLELFTLIDCLMSVTNKDVWRHDRHFEWLNRWSILPHCLNILSICLF